MFKLILWELRFFDRMGWQEILVLLLLPVGLSILRRYPGLDILAHSPIFLGREDFDFGARQKRK